MTKCIVWIIESATEIGYWFHESHPIEEDK